MLSAFCQVIPYLWAHMYTYTHNRRPCNSPLGERIPTLADQNGHIWLQIPKERRLASHLEPDTQPNLDSAALSRIWQPTDSATDHDSLSLSFPAESFSFQKFQVETKGGDSAQYFRLPCRSTNSLPQRSTIWGTLACQVRNCGFTYSYNK